MLKKKKKKKKKKSTCDKDDLVIQADICEKLKHREEFPGCAPGIPSCASFLFQCKNAESKEPG